MRKQMWGFPSVYIQIKVALKKKSLKELCVGRIF